MATSSHAPPTAGHSGRNAAADPAGHDDRKQVARVRYSGPETIDITVPFVGTLRLSRPELAYISGIVGLSALGLLEWPIGLVIAGGHILAADRSSRTVQDLGEAMTQA